MLKDRRRCQSADFSNKTPGWCSATVMETKSKVEPRSTLDINVTAKGDLKIHFFPQDIHAYISPSSPQVFNITYKLGRAYPLDVYLLVDYSSTMNNKNDQAKSPFQILRDNTADIAKQLAKFTDNVNLGAGLFMEKPVLPYAQYEALTFNHTHRLGSNAEEISDLFKVGSWNKHCRVGCGNNEDPEATLDALMQVMACKNEVGWRDVARRIIVLCTDSTYHSAGDGKMLGIFKPCDEKCRLENNTYYTASKIYDYPSVGLIKKVARDKNVQILFVAPEGLRRVYQSLSNEILGSAYVPLKDNFLSSISREYEKSLRHPRLVVKYPSNIKVTIEPACNEQDIEACEIDLDRNKTVQVRVELTSCPKTDKTETVEIGLLGLDNKLSITVHPLCKCDCEHSNDIGTSNCGSNGFLQCGICKCNDGWSGDLCECEGEQMDPTYLKKCKLLNDGLTCSGRGNCRCGSCRCDKGFSGKYCEFDDLDCILSSDGKMCADHGECTEGKCRCLEHWTGNDCSCTLSNETCISPYRQLECFGNGHCKCGKCACNTPAKPTISYYGRFCQSSEPKCTELDKIVQCRFYNTSDSDNCSETNYQEIRVLKKTEFDDLEHSFLLCTIVTDKGGIIKYKYQELANTYADKLHVRIQDELENPGLPVHIWAVTGSIIGTVVLVGLLTLLIWKILIDRRDAKEYAQYEEDIKKQTHMEENQLYRGPASLFSNPMYNCNE